VLVLQEVLVPELLSSVLLESLLLTGLPLLLVEVHPLEEGQLRVGVRESHPGLVLALDKRVRVLEQQVVQMLGVAFHQHVVVHQVYNIIGAHASRPLHLR